MKREELEAALAKPTPTKADIGDMAFFDPWDDVIHGIYGSYSSECDELMLLTLKAVRDGKTFELMKEHGFAAELMLYILAGHGLTEYGTSPRGAWPDHPLRDLWQPLIDKWEAFYAASWPTE